MNGLVVPPLSGARIRLRPFGAGDIGPRYLAWLNDPVVNEYSRRRDLPPATADQARAYLDGLAVEEPVLAIEAEGLGHVGNIKFGPVDRANARADISILIGERAAWGKGIGAEATHVLSRWLFQNLGLNRLDAGSANPAFLAMVAKLGWSVEGVLRERVRLAGRFLDWTLVSQLSREFTAMPRYAPC